MKNQNEQPAPTSNKHTDAQSEVLKLGLDIHKSKYVVVQQFDNESPKSPQRFTPEAFLEWIAQQRKRVNRVVTCYEAGCFWLRPAQTAGKNGH